MYKREIWFVVQQSSRLMPGLKAKLYSEHLFTLLYFFTQILISERFIGKTHLMFLAVDESCEATFDRVLVV